MAGIDWSKAGAFGAGILNDTLWGIPEAILSKTNPDIVQSIKSANPDAYQSGQNLSAVAGLLLPGAGVLKAGKALKAASTAKGLTRAEKISKMLGMLADESKATKAFEASRLIDAPNKINWKLGDIGYGLPVVFDEGEDMFRIAKGPEGFVWKASPAYRGRESYMQTRLMKKADEFFSPLAEDEYIRVAHDPMDYEYARNKTLRESINHATGESEGGISVAKSPEFKGKIAYYLKGKKIGIGTDGEPLLDPKSIEVTSKPMTYEEMTQDLHKKLEKIAQKYGLDARTLNSYMASLYLKRGW